jgi:hypothetical protein
MPRAPPSRAKRRLIYTVTCARLTELTQLESEALFIFERNSRSHVHTRQSRVSF